MAASIETARVVQHHSSTADLEGATLVEGYLIKDMVPSVNPLIQFLNCPGVPIRGDVHPDSDVLTAQKFDTRPFRNSRSKVWGLVTYRPYHFDPINKPVIELHATTKQVTRYHDAIGNTILVKYTAADGTVYPDQVEMISDTVATGILHAEWVEYSDPTARLLPLNNCINNSTYKAGAKYTWWVASVNIAKVKYVQGYRISVDVLYDPETWIQTIPYRLFDGSTPSDLDYGAIRLKAPGGSDAAGPYNGFVRGTVKGIANLTDLQIPTV